MGNEGIPLKGALTLTLSRSRERGNSLQSAKVTPYFIMGIMIFLLMEVPLRAEEWHELTLQECIKLALESNQGLKSASFAPLQARAGLLSARSMYDFALTGSFGHRDANEPQVSSVFGTKTETTETSLSIDKKIGLGGVSKISFDNQKIKSNSIFQTINPSYRSHLIAKYSQPLFRNFLGREDRAIVESAELEALAAQERYRREVENVIDRVHDEYWQLALVIQDETLSQRALTEARKLEHYLSERQKLGLAQETEIMAAQAATVTREAELLLAGNAVSQLAKQFSFLLGQSSLQVRPKEALIGKNIEFSNQKLYQNHFDHQPRVRILKQEIKSLEASLRRTRESKKPEVSLDGSLTYTGLSGTSGSEISSVFQLEHPTWFVGASLRWALFGLSGRADFSRTAWRMAEKKTRLIELMDQLQINIVRAQQSLEVQVKRLEKLRKANVLHERKLKLGQERFRIGRVDAYRFIDFQRELRESERRLLLAHYDYRRARFTLERETGQLLSRYKQ